MRCGRRGEWSRRRVYGARPTPRRVLLEIDVANLQDRTRYEANDIETKREDDLFRSRMPATVVIVLEGRRAGHGRGDGRGTSGPFTDGSAMTEHELRANARMATVANRRRLTCGIRRTSSRESARGARPRSRGQ